MSRVQNFGAPSFDDKKLEVVAVFGSMQMAMSRVINLQHHRIAQVTHTHTHTHSTSTAAWCFLVTFLFCFVACQCRQVKITILGEEGVPVQVDGEAWIQPPGIVKIVHRNRAQMLTRDRVKREIKCGLQCSEELCPLFVFGDIQPRTQRTQPSLMFMHQNVHVCCMTLVFLVLTRVYACV